MTITRLTYFKLDIFSGHVLCYLIEIASRYSDTTNQRTRTFARNTLLIIPNYSYR